MTLQESARLAYQRLWTILVTATSPVIRDECMWELNFLQPFTEPGFRDWAKITLPFFNQFELEGIHQRHLAILESLEMLFRRLEAEKEERDNGSE